MSFHWPYEVDDMTLSVAANILPNNKATKLTNVSCVYCGCEETAESPLTDEHVVGRRFVPKGSFATGWSLIVRACTGCNGEKADLEDEISAITLLPDLGTVHERPDLVEIAARKAAKSRSRRTKKTIGDSYEEGKIEGKLMSVADVSFGFVAPPQLVPERVHRLAWFHIQGFFYLITYDEAKQAGSFLPGEYGWVNDARRPDWGNPLQRSFADLTAGWNTRIEGEGADGYFKIAIRRDPSGAEIWSFALEWNRCLRSIGFFGDIDAAQRHVDGLHPLQFKRIDATRRMRLETALDESEDHLFKRNIAE
jgi:hypothetical protein